MDEVAKMKLTPTILWLLVGLLAGCGKSPEKAKLELASKGIPVTDAALLEHSKSRASQSTAKELLIAGADPNARQANGMTVLMSAALNGQVETVAELLKRGADMEIEVRGYTALITAVSSGSKEVVELLLAKGAKVNYKTETGNTALRAARGGKQAEIEQILLKAGAKE